MDIESIAVLDSMRFVSRRLLPLCAALSLCARLLTAQPFDIFPLDKIEAGMKGYGVTDMGDGRGIQKFDVEVLGLLKRFAPGPDLILARVNRIGLEKAGIIARMTRRPPSLHTTFYRPP